MPKPSDGKIIGYARVSTEDQNLAIQLKELKSYGCSKIFQDKASGAKTERPGLSECLESMGAGDVLVVWRLDRLGRSMQHLVSVVNSLNSRKIGFKSICDGNIDTTTASGELIFNLFASLAQFEAKLIKERTFAGLKAARSRGKLGGRKPVTGNSPVVKAAKKMHQNQDISIQEICESLKISKATLYRYLAL